MSDMFFSIGSAKTHNSGWKTLSFSYSDIDEKGMYQTHHISKGVRILFTDKLSKNELYLILLPNIIHKPSSNIYIKKCLKTQL